MIRYLDREDLDIDKYNDCVENSIQFNVFGYSWYLDIACTKWGVYVLNDYDAVMPVPWRKKMFIKYVYPPLWIIQLGIYSKLIEDENEFLIEVFDDFRLVELRMNTHNSFSFFGKFQNKRKLQIISLTNSYESIKDGYNRNRKRELKKSEDLDFTENWEDDPLLFLELFKNNVGKKIRKIKEIDYDNLYRLIKMCLEKKLGDLLTIYDKNDNLISGAFFLKQKNRVTELVCSSDLKKRKNGANTFMNDRAIFRYQKHFDIFDFGGSSMKRIAKYYTSFGAKDEGYIQLKYNNLPRFLKLLKR